MWPAPAFACGSGAAGHGRRRDVTSDPFPSPRVGRRGYDCRPGCPHPGGCPSERRPRQHSRGQVSVMRPGPVLQRETSAAAAALQPGVTVEARCRDGAPVRGRPTRARRRNDVEGSGDSTPPTRLTRARKPETPRRSRGAKWVANAFRRTNGAEPAAGGGDVRRARAHGSRRPRSPGRCRGARARSRSSESSCRRRGR